MDSPTEFPRTLARQLKKMFSAGGVGVSSSLLATTKVFIRIRTIVKIAAPITQYSSAKALSSEFFKTTDPSGVPVL